MFIDIPALLREAACISKLQQHHVDMAELSFFTNNNLFLSLPILSPRIYGA